MSGPRRALVCSACLSAWCLLIPPLALADPLPMEEVYAGGRIMPARAVPVDMTSETLRVTITPRRTKADLPYHLCNAAVVADYLLIADHPVTVPVLFPAVGEVDSFLFALNGRRIPGRLVSGTELLAPYAERWRETIDRAVAADPGLAEICAQAERDLRAVRRRAAEESRRPDDLHIHSRLVNQLERRLQQMGVPEPDHVAWCLAHEVMDDWGDYRDDLHMTDEQVAGLRFANERFIALAFDRHAPDPLALWDDGHPHWGLAPSMDFAVAELSLRAGENRFCVSYRQPVGFRNRPRVREGTLPSHEQVSRFEFVLRTARFWRSFGDLDVAIQLPPGTEQVQCSLPGARISPGDAPTVTVSTRGLPATNLAVDFAAVPWGEAEPTNADVAPDVPRVGLEPVWETVLQAGRSHARTPAAVDDGQVIACAGPEVAVFDLHSGERLMTCEVAGEAVMSVPWRDRILVGMVAPGKRYHAKLGLVCLQRNTGEELWSVTSDLEKSAAPEVRPLIAGDTAVVWAPYFGLMGVDLETGERLWERRFDGTGADADDRRVYVCGGHERYHEGLIVALDVRSGNALWEIDPEGMVEGVKVTGDELLVRAGGGDRVWAVAVDDGHDLGSRPRVPISTDYVHSGQDTGSAELVVTPGGGLKRIDAETGESIWLAPRRGRDMALWTLVGERCVSLQRIGGSLVCWQVTDAPAERPEAPVHGAPPADLPKAISGTLAGGVSPSGSAATGAGAGLMLVLVALAGLAVHRARARGSPEEAPAARD